MLAPLLHPAPRSGEGGPPCSGRVVEGASDSNLARPHAPSTTLRVVPLPRTSCGSGQNEIVLATHSRARALPTTTTPSQKKIRFRQSKREAERRKAHAIHVRAAQTSVRSLRHSSATRLRAHNLLPPPLAGESQGGDAPAFRRSRLRHSPPAITPMAQPQNRVSRRRAAQVFCPLGPSVGG